MSTNSFARTHSSFEATIHASKRIYAHAHSHRLSLPPQPSDVAASQPRRTPSTLPERKHTQQTHQNERPNACLCQYACRRKLWACACTARRFHFNHRCRQLLSHAERPAHHLHADSSSTRAKIGARTPTCASTRLKHCHTPADANYGRAHAPLVASTSTIGAGNC